MRGILQVILVCLVGLGLGGASALYSIKRSHGIGGINVGPWTAWPFASGGNTDPYTVARVAREGTIPLGTSEGLAFEASRDDGGRLLRLECDYTLTGTTPPAKLWTLSAYDPRGRQIRSKAGEASALQSTEILRFDDGSFRINISARPRPGNWMATSGNGEMLLVLRVYDTPVSGTSGLAAPRMPSILMGRCDP